MADRQVLGTNTFEEFRVEFNELATDVGDIANLTGASGIIASATDVIEAITTLNTSIGNTVDLPDSSGVNVGRIKLGDSDDLQIYHNGSNSVIEDVGTGVLKVKSDGAGINLQKGDSELLATFGTDNAVALYFDNSKKLETNAAGVAVTGNLTATGDIVKTGDLTLDASGDIVLDADGGDVNFKDGGTTIGSLQNSSSDLLIASLVQDKDIKFRGNDAGGTVVALTLDMSEEGKAIFNKDIQLNNSGSISNGSVNLTFPSVGGTVSTEGFSIALATALG